MIVIRLIIAGGTLLFGLFIYPYYVDYFLTPIIALAKALKPDMNILEDTYLTLLPFILLLVILFVVVMGLLGKVGIHSRRDEP